jgi:hypothetical protein
MKRIITIAIEVADDDRIDEEDRIDELAYWVNEVDKATAIIQRDYDRSRSNADSRVTYQAVDFTTLSIHHGDALVVNTLIDAAEAHARDLEEMIGNTDPDQDERMSDELDRINQAISAVAAKEG